MSGSGFWMSGSRFCHNTWACKMACLLMKCSHLEKSIMLPSYIHTNSILNFFNDFLGLISCHVVILKCLANSENSAYSAYVTQGSSSSKRRT